MPTLKKLLSPFGALLCAIAVLLPAAIVAVLSQPSSAYAQVTPRSLTTLTLSATTVTASSTVTLTSSTIMLKPGSGFAIVPTFAQSAAGTGNVTFNFAVSTDGTTWSTTTPLTYTVAATGTTSVVAFKNFGVADGADNILYARLASVTNSNTPSNTIISSIVVTKDN